MIVAADTSGLIALFNRGDPVHHQARKVADNAGMLVTSPLALTEVHQVATSRAGRTVADAILSSLTARMASQRLVLADTTATLIDTGLAIRARYGDLDLDLVDAVTVAIAAEYDTDAVLTRDERDFRAVRPLRRWTCFRVLPADGY